MVVTLNKEIDGGNSKKMIKINMADPKSLE